MADISAYGKTVNWFAGNEIMLGDVNRDLLPKENSARTPPAAAFMCVPEKLK